MKFAVLDENAPEDAVVWPDSVGSCHRGGCWESTPVSGGIDRTESRKGDVWTKFPTWFILDNGRFILDNVGSDLPEYKQRRMQLWSWA